ncbi:MAG: transposase [Nitrospira sp.]|nr:transposase [Nitrospira sp.]
MRKYYPDWQFTEIGIDKDQVHVHRVIPQKYSVSVAVETIKQNTNRRLRNKLRFLDRGVLGSRRNLVNRLLCVHGGDYGRNHEGVRSSTREGRRGTSAA